VTIAWVELFAVFVVSHLTGDFILQTEFQALNKHGGLGRDAVRRRALAGHTLSYTACYVPALVWLASDGLSAPALVATALGIAVPHGLQDDGRPMRWWMRRVKHTEPQPGVLAMALDQSFHLVALLLLAILVGV
jgi:Protein of unknown function (DUF3307)